MTTTQDLILKQLEKLNNSSGTETLESSTEYLYVKGLVESQFPDREILSIVPRQVNTMIYDIENEIYDEFTVAHPDKLFYMGGVVCGKWEFRNDMEWSGYTSIDTSVHFYNPLATGNELYVNCTNQVFPKTLFMSVKGYLFPSNIGLYYIQAAGWRINLKPLTE
jgi:hypothetical protein